MLGRIVAHVAALAQGSKVAGAIVAWIVVQMRCGKYYTRNPQSSRRINAGQPRLHTGELVGRKQPADRPALPVAPLGLLLVPPDAVAQMQNVKPVRTLALLAATFCAFKPDDRGQLAPVDRIKTAVFARDGHNKSMIQNAPKQKRKTAVCLLHNDVEYDN